jgi:DNA-binding NarL/FixJ family response regulator
VSQHPPHPRSTPDDPPGDLSALQVAVGRMLVLGYSGTEIATRLRCDLDEVVAVVRSLRARYDVPSTAEAVRRAVVGQDLFRP